MTQQTLKSEPILQTENNHGDCLLEEKKKTDWVLQDTYMMNRWTKKKHNEEICIGRQNE